MSDTIVTPAAFLASVLSDGSAARDRVIVKAFGAEATGAHVTLALRAARVREGLADKPRGGAADRINRVIRDIDGLYAVDAHAVVTADTYVMYARAVLDAHAEEQRAAREARKTERAAAKSVADDRGAPIEDRVAAFARMASIDGESADERKSRAVATLRSAVAAALRTLPADAVLDIVQDAVAEALSAPAAA